MRMITIPNQSSVAKAFMEFEENGRMKPSSYYDRIIDGVMEELVRFTVLTRAHAGQLHSERHVLVNRHARLLRGDEAAPVGLCPIAFRHKVREDDHTDPTKSTRCTHMGAHCADYYASAGQAGQNRGGVGSERTRRGGGRRSLHDPTF